MKYIGQITVFIMVAIFSTFVNGWALQVLWTWFISTTFHLPILSIAQAIGLSLVVTYMTMKLDSKPIDPMPYTWQILTAVFTVIIKVGVVLGTGLIIKQFI